MSLPPTGPSGPPGETAMAALLRRSYLPEFAFPDFAAKRHALGLVMVNSGGFEALSLEDQVTACDFYLVDDQAVHQATQKAWLQRHWTAALGELKELEQQHETALAALSAADMALLQAQDVYDDVAPPELVQARTEAEAALHQAEQTRDATWAAWQTAEAKFSLSQHHQAVADAQGVVNQAASAQQEAQTALAADPDNVTLQDALTEATAALADAQTALAAATQALGAHEAMHTAYQSASQALAPAQAAVQQTLAAFATYLATDTAGPLLAARTALQTAIAEYLASLPEGTDPAVSDAGLASLEQEHEVQIAPLRQQEADQLELRAADALWRTRAQTRQQRYQTTRELEARRASAENEVTRLARPDEEWTQLARAKVAVKSMEYHAGMRQSRAERMDLVITDLFRTFNPAVVQSMAGALFLKQELYVRAGVKGVHVAPGPSGIYDFLYSEGDFQGAGFLESGLVPREGTLLEVRNRLVSWLEYRADTPPS